MSKRWWLINIAVVSLAFLAGTLLGTWQSTGAPPVPDEIREPDRLEKVTFGGELCRQDYEMVRQIVEEHPNLMDRQIASIDVVSPRRIEVHTGGHHPPLSGGSDTLYLVRTMRGLLLVHHVDRRVH
jgi:hypothetical protein